MGGCAASPVAIPTSLEKIHEIFLSFGGRLSDFFGVFERDEKDLCSAFTSWMVMVMG